jgi:hypothetical protein
MASDSRVQIVSNKPVILWKESLCLRSGISFRRHHIKDDFDQLAGLGGAKRFSGGASIRGPRYFTSPNL